MPIGPSLPPAGPQLPSAGPQLPPHLAASLAASAPAEDDDDSDDDFGPSLPPDMVDAHKARAVAGPQLPEKKVMGPMMPPGFDAGAGGDEPPRKRETPLSNLYSDDDDDFGPMPLPAGYRVEDDTGVRAFREREEREQEKRRLQEEGEGKGKLQREEWMLVPPKEMDLLSSMDSTKLKSRTFQQSSKPDSKKQSGPNLWTETPAERQQRMADEMMGKKRKAEVSAGGGGAEEEESDDKRRRRERDRQLRDEVERHNKAARATSLLDSHAKSKKAKGDDKDGPPGIWDRDRDMAVGGRLMDDAKRADVVKNAKELGGRFGGGSYL
ncbi:hypothetical protein MNV49_006696 [Pseudohyphozyma bogoriensis]|nr:hypothetical protein MNV49_006696 [Pseudohyphozyma bogoriensis]